LIRDSRWPLPHVWYIARPIGAGPLNHVTFHLNQLCRSRQEDNFAEIICAFSSKFLYDLVISSQSYENMKKLYGYLLSKTCFKIKWDI
jgi:hypothetical protein